MLNIGELVDAPYPYTARILFTDLATGRETALANEGSGVEVSIDTEDFTPIAGHTYMVKVVLTSEGGGIIPAEFKTYTLTDANLFEVGSITYTEAQVRFQKVYEVDGDVNEATEQWLTVR